MALLPGDRMTVLNLSGEQLDVRSPERTPLTVVGMFRTGYLDFDRNWGFVSLETARSLVGRGESPVIGIKLRNRFRDQAAQAAVASHLAERYGGGRFEVGSWRQYNRAIFGALRMEKTFLIVLIGLIFIVVGANIHQSLKRSVRERLEEIAVLKTLGARPREVQLVFVLEGIITGFVGATVGTLAGLALAVNIEGLFAAIEAVVNTGIGLSVALFGGGGAANVEIFSSQYFYLTEVPSEVIFLEVLGIYLFGWLSAAVAAYVASRSVVGVRPAQVLREE
jgi:lipoprotein-releasing system permease protein